MHLPHAPLLQPSRRLDAHRLMPRLWQGSYPPEGRVLAEVGFQALALCAYELQAAEAFEGVSVLLCPLDDARLTDLEAHRARHAAVQLEAAWRQGKRVLVTCAAGRNRSGLVSALLIRQLLDCSGVDAATQVRSQRPSALTNPSFLGYLESLGRPSQERKRSRRPARR